MRMLVNEIVNIGDSVQPVNLHKKLLILVIYYRHAIIANVSVLSHASKMYERTVKLIFLFETKFSPL